jgi:glycosyltransferase involved in cell wall biosynthesis
MGIIVNIMPKLVACYNVFNEVEFLEESLESIYGKVDDIIVIDGAYKKFPHNKPFSTDGSIEIALKYTDKVIIPHQEWASEIIKRNQYLSLMDVGDICLVIDGHEIWKGDFNPPFGNYRIKMLMKDGWHSFPRMFEKEEGMEYRESHYQLFVKNDKIDMEWAEYPYGYLSHRDITDKARIRQKENFYKIIHFDQ